MLTYLIRCPQLVTCKPYISHIESMFMYCSPKQRDQLYCCWVLPYQIYPFLSVVSFGFLLKNFVTAKQPIKQYTCACLWASLNPFTVLTLIICIFVVRHPSPRPDLLAWSQAARSSILWRGTIHLSLTRLWKQAA